MNRHTEARLLEFCASQHRRFSAQAWVAFPEKNGCFLPPTPSTHPPPPPPPATLAAARCISGQHRLVRTPAGIARHR
ncbi:hypothetical protein Ga0100231_000925 [Opitutaceae bacterium TAV4]|nr:hypothetical protein Ga0100231_000925 [Opitutaceae bacterium TAV4]